MKTSPKDACSFFCFQKDFNNKPICTNLCKPIYRKNKSRVIIRKTGDAPGMLSACQKQVFEECVFLFAWWRKRGRYDSLQYQTDNQRVCIHYIQSNYIHTWLLIGIRIHSRHCTNTVALRAHVRERDREWELIPPRMYNVNCFVAWR